MMGHFETLQVTGEPGLLRIRLNRPHRQNSINGTLLDELHAALDLAEHDPACRMVVLSGSGGTFCTGMDFADAVDGEAEDLAERGGQAFWGLLERLTAIPRVVVSQVDGRVSGGGVGLVAAGDFVHASPRSSFSLPEALWGLLPCCVLPFLIRRVGFQPAHAMTLSTLPISADEAHRGRLVDEVGEDAEPYLRKLRMRLSKLDGTTLGEAKRYLGRLWSLSQETERYAVTEFARLMSAPAVRERITGFATRNEFPWEKR
ncbi:enoyl-CoA hydratase-related protein [Sphaerimonospora sp. CA-214678]|uniref:enoyl-CoA hydratase-related protein n=1 Tax=Sphaerimonospora sp. CA-214678 TaxID=3240029 RepID=UPI003D92F5A1